MMRGFETTANMLGSAGELLNTWVASGSTALDEAGTEADASGTFANGTKVVAGSEII